MSAAAAPTAVGVVSSVVSTAPATAASVKSSKDWGTIYQILPFLYLSGYRVAETSEQLQSHGITHILNATADHPTPAHSKQLFTVRELKLYDIPTQSLVAAFDDSFQFIESVRSHQTAAASNASTATTAATASADSKGASNSDAATNAPKASAKVLVHCSVGISRSASLVIHYVMKHLSRSLSESFDLVKTAKPNVEPQPVFLQQLSDAEFALTGKRTFDVDKYKIRLLTSTMPITPQQAETILAQTGGDYTRSMAAAAVLAYDQS